MDSLTEDKIFLKALKAIKIPNKYLVEVTSKITDIKTEITYDCFYDVYTLVNANIHGLGGTYPADKYYELQDAGKQRLETDDTVVDITMAKTIPFYELEITF